MGLTRDIAQFAIGTSGDEISKQALAVMSLSLMDWFAVAIAGKDEPASRIVFQIVQEEGGATQSSILGSPVKYPARAAALANGVASHALDYDDTHFAYVGHPSAVIVPATLALAESHGCTGQKFLDAALIGAESACLIGTWLGRRHYQAGFHQTATAGCLGATLACARLLGFDMEQTQHAVGIASTRTAGLKSQFGTMGKPYNAGAAAANAVESALLAGHGFTSAGNALECGQGFSATHAGEEHDLGDIPGRFRNNCLLESVQHKFHSCCHGIHASLEALTQIIKDHRFSHEEIKRVSVSVNPRWVKVCHIKQPKTGLEAKFSYRFALAMLALGIDTAAPASFVDEVCQSTELGEFAARVQVEPDEEHPDTAATVTVETHSGSIHDQYYDLENLPDLAIRTRKVQAKAGSLIGEAVAQQIWSSIQALPHNSINQFMQDANCF
ncbi:MAG: MmgE/PrpD family protein [Gammaproteobacteria bacterium]|nr:MmgE/PrpD family protein [Gammaproteobacteria bacterium]